MEENNAPYFLLSAKDHKHAPERTIYSNRGQDGVDLKSGPAMFDKQLEIHGENPNQVFVVKFYRTKTGSHSAGELGPFEFQLAGADPQSQNQHQSGSSLNGVPGLSGQFNEAIGSLGALYGKRDELLLERGKLNTERALFDRDKKEFEEEKREFKKEIKELEAKFNSQSERVKAGAEKALYGLLDGYLKTGQVNGQPLAGTQAQEEPETEEMQRLNNFLNEIVDAAEEQEWTLQQVIEFENEVRELLIHKNQNTNGIHEN